MKRPARPERLCRDLEEVAVKLFDEVRRDTGSFQTGACTLHGKKLLMVNIRQPADERVAALAHEIALEGADRLYLKPAVREEIERWAPAIETPERS